MLARLSIKSLYSLALAEGEGVGTAYEYYAKRLVLRPWLNRLGRVRRILVAGLPEKYGASLDFIQLGAELQARVTVLDERAEAIAKAEESVANAQAGGWYRDLAWDMMLVKKIGALDGLSRDYDLSISSELLQRLSDEERAAYVSRLRRLSRGTALFAPNADNPAHTRLSGLDGLRLEQLVDLPGLAPGASGYIDMPPFPPGMVRSEAQREQAASGRVEALAMRSLATYARMERFFPLFLRRRQAHIIYALSP